MVFEKPQKCYFYRNSSCYLLYTTPAMGRILNILPAPLMEIWCGVIWVLIWINQIYLLVLSDVTRPGSCRLFCFLCSCHIPVLELLQSRAMWGAALSVPPAGLSLSPELLLQGKCNGRVSPMGRCWACAGETGMPLSLFSVQ